MSLNRRQLLKSSAQGVGLVVVGRISGAFDGGPVRAVAESLPPAGGGFGGLVPDPDGLLDLPEGFSYKVISEVGRPDSDGVPLPDCFDGTGLFAGVAGGSVLVRNSEQDEKSKFPVRGAPEFTYDPAAEGGTTTTEIDSRLTVVNEYVSLAGTARNCAGGVTPWGTWLTCEETEVVIDDGFEKDHGFVFEVDPFHVANNENPTPLEGLGRFAHEAAAIDPNTGIVYLTEDASQPSGLLYRALPNDVSGTYGSLRAGAQLQALVATDGGTFVADLSAYDEVGTSLTLGWIDVIDPLAVEAPIRAQMDGLVTRVSRLEGAWWGNDSAYLVSSFARLDAGSTGEHNGQVWRLDPIAETMELVAWFSNDAERRGKECDSPDNITGAPWGGLVVCADGTTRPHLWALLPDGHVSRLARNARDASEFAGVAFSADGSTLFVNTRSPGATYAITGPWIAATPPDSEPRTPFSDG